LIAQKRVPHFGYEQHQFWALEEPEYKSLPAEEIATLTVYTRAICDSHAAASISDVTHNAAWQLAAMGEEIPFAAFMGAQGAGRATPDEFVEIERRLGA